MLLYTLQDLETGEVRSVMAPSEGAARALLGGLWQDVERVAAWTPCEIANLPQLIEEARTAERTSLEEATAANPVRANRPSTKTTVEAIAAFSAAQKRHRQLQAHRQELERLARSE